MIRNVPIALLTALGLSSCFISYDDLRGADGGKVPPGTGTGGLGGTGGFGGSNGFGGGGGFFSFDGGGCGFSFSDAGVDSRPVVAVAKAPLPISGGTLAVMASGTVVAADPDRDRVWVVSALGSLAHEVVLSSGEEPGRVVEGPQGRAFVALRGAGAVAELNVATGQVVARHPACAAPRGMGWSAAKSTLTVACATGVLARLGFTVGNNSLTLSSRVLQYPGEDLRDVVVRPNDVLVSTFRSAKVLQVADDGLTQQVPMPGTGGAMVPRVAYRMVASGSGVLIAHQLQQSLPLPLAPCGTSYAGSGFGGADGGKPRAILASALTAIGVGSPPEQLPDVVLPVDVAVGANGDWALVAAGTRQTLWFHKASGFVERIASPGEPSAVEFRGSELIIFEREPAAIYVKASAAVSSRFPLPGVSMASTGHELFHRAMPAGVACASCHPEGTDDGHTWNLPEGPRRTNMLRGGLKASAPFHWQGDRADMKELLSDVMVQRMGGVAQTAQRSAALLDWLDGVPALPLPDNLDASAVARGKALFDAPQQQCLACHPGPLGTNNLNSNVGTGAAFQVPRLVGLAMRAPYFHDGRVLSLADRFAPQGGGESHGRTAALTAAERADLVEYLRSR